MDETATAPGAVAEAPAVSPASRRPWRARVTVAFAVLVVPLLLVAGITASSAPRGKVSLASIPVVSAAALESEFGIRVDLIGVTAAGGLVQLRFTVTDEQKAALAFHEDGSLPSLAVESRGLVITAPNSMVHHLKVLGGASYFILYSNPGGYVQAGTPVSVLIGNVRLAPITAQS